ncbi:MAG: phospholipase A [Deltaproteobacteria bacterium]|nr:phospholipase A [Deltaproteobacteria bacterium]
MNPESKAGKDGCRVIGISLGIFLVVGWTLMASASVSADGLETVIAPPTIPPQAGKVAEFSVYVHNIGEGIVSVQLPVQVSCRIESGDQTIDVVAKTLEPFEKQPVVVGKNGFIKGRYEFSVPTGLSGPVRMEVREFQAASVMFAVAPAEEPKTQALGRISSEPLEHYPTIDSLFALYQPYLVNLAAYESMYFLVGTNPEKSKFQISFKYRFLDPEGDLAEELPWLKGLHFGYTQTSFWDLKSDSAPFEDTSYKPELFFLSSNIKKRPSWMQGFFLQTGFQHESNGRGGEFSRNTNQLYAKPFFILYDNKTQLGIQIAPKIWTYVHNDNDTNPDLEDYRGFFDLEVKLGKADSFVLESHLRWADEGVSTQWDFTYPLHQHVFRHLGFYFQAQYVNALAESLIDYRERNEALRLGLAIVR